MNNSEIEHIRQQNAKFAGRNWGAKSYQLRMESKSFEESIELVFVKNLSDAPSPLCHNDLNFFYVVHEYVSFLLSKIDELESKLAEGER